MGVVNFDISIIPQDYPWPNLNGVEQVKRPSHSDKGGLSEKVIQRGSKFSWRQYLFDTYPHIFYLLHVYLLRKIFKYCKFFEKF